MQKCVEDSQVFFELITEAMTHYYWLEQQHRNKQNGRHKDHKTKTTKQEHKYFLYCPQSASYHPTPHP